MRRRRGGVPPAAPTRKAADAAAAGRPARVASTRTRRGRGAADSAIRGPRVAAAGARRTGAPRPSRPPPTCQPAPASRSRSTPPRPLPQADCGGEAGVGAQRGRRRHPHRHRWGGAVVLLVACRPPASPRQPVTSSRSATGRAARASRTAGTTFPINVLASGRAAPTVPSLAPIDALPAFVASPRADRPTHAVMAVNVLLVGERNSGSHTEATLVFSGVTFVAGPTCHRRPTPNASDATRQTPPRPCGSMERRYSDQTRTASERESQTGARPPANRCVAARVLIRRTAITHSAHHVSTEDRGRWVRTAAAAAQPNTGCVMGGRRRSPPPHGRRDKQVREGGGCGSGEKKADRDNPRVRRYGKEQSVHAWQGKRGVERR